MERLLDDTSKWVKQAVRQNLGPFLSTLDSATLTPKLVACFANMPAASAQEGSASTTVACAFSLPGVLLAIGESRSFGGVRVRVRVQSPPGDR